MTLFDPFTFPLFAGISIGLVAGLGSVCLLHLLRG